MIRWVVEGERNTKYFQGWVKQKRVKSRIHVINDGDRVLSDEEDIRASTAGFFQTILSSHINVSSDLDIDGLVSLPSSVDAQNLCDVPNLEEV